MGLLGLPLSFLIIFVIGRVHSHGRLMWPPSRSSLWRHSQFQKYNPPVNYNDNELFCGSVHQVDHPGSKCGVCGDPFDQKLPRDNEVGGKFYKGIISAKYQVAQIIRVVVELTRSHLGFMEFRICPDLQFEGEQQCFNNYLLQRADARGSKVNVSDDTGTYEAYYVLPPRLNCSHCVLQWNYRAGNNWGVCKNGTGALGCGAQEGCADISIEN